jgi:cell division initiation protein
MAGFNLPKQPSAEQIRGREFSSVRRGYDPDQVRDYLYSMAERLESMERELQETQQSMQQMQAQTSSQAAAVQEVPPEQDPYEAFGKRIAGLLATADKEGNRLVKDAKTEAKRIVEEARSEAAQIRVDADTEAEKTRAEGSRVLEQAREDADRALAGLAGRRRVLADQLETMQSRLLETAKSIEGIMDEPYADAMPITEIEALGEAGGPDPQAPLTSTTESDPPDFSGVEFDLDADNLPGQDG